MTLNTFTSGVNTTFSTELNENFDLNNKILTEALQNRIDTLRSITERTPSDIQDNSKRDIFTDADGKNNTINTGNTDAVFNTDHYIAKTTSAGSDNYTNAPSNTTVQTITTNCTAISEGIISSIRCYNSITGSNVTATISQGGTVASKVQAVSSGAVFTISFSSSDYSALLQPGAFTITLHSSAGSTLSQGNSGSFSGTYFSFSAQNVPADSPSSGIASFTYTQTSFADSVVETNQLTNGGSNIKSVFLTVQDEDDGTDKLTYDVSSDNGSTYTTGLSPNQLNSITSTQGNQLIIKLNIQGQIESKLYGYAYKTFR